MTTVWERVQALQGHTLYTAMHRKPFDIIEVTHDRVYFIPQEGKGVKRFYYREDIEHLYNLRLKEGPLKPIHQRTLWPNDQNTSYVPVIINEVYRLGEQD